MVSREANPKDVFQVHRKGITEMSQTIELPSVEEAAATLDNVYAQRLFDKLAERGYSPQTDEQKIATLQAALMLDQEPEQPQQAGANDPFVAATQKLAAARGVSLSPAADPSQERIALAQAIAQDPDFFKSAVALAQNQAE